MSCDIVQLQYLAIWLSCIVKNPVGQGGYACLPSAIFNNSTIFLGSQSLAPQVLTGIPEKHFRHVIES